MKRIETMQITWSNAKDLIEERGMQSEKSTRRYTLDQLLPKYGFSSKNATCTSTSTSIVNESSRASSASSTSSPDSSVTDNQPNEDLLSTLEMEELDEDSSHMTVDMDLGTTTDEREETEEKKQSSHSPEMSLLKNGAQPQATGLGASPIFEGKITATRKPENQSTTLSSAVRQLNFDDSGSGPQDEIVPQSPAAEQNEVVNNSVESAFDYADFVFSDEDENGLEFDESLEYHGVYADDDCFDTSTIQGVSSKLENPYGSQYYEDFLSQGVEDPESLMCPQLDDPMMFSLSTEENVDWDEDKEELEDEDSSDGSDGSSDESDEVDGDDEYSEDTSDEEELDGERHKVAKRLFPDGDETLSDSDGSSSDDDDEEMYEGMYHMEEADDAEGDD